MFMVRKLFMVGYVTKKVFCLYCQYCHKHNKFLQAANICDNAFTTSGFDNIKKALEKFLTHDTILKLLGYGVLLADQQ